MANTIEIVIKQSGQGSAISTTVKELGGLDKAASNSIGVLGRFGSALGSMGTIAGGIIAANLFGKLFDGISSIVSVGLDAVGSNQQLETSLKSLLTANLMYTESTETVTSAITKQIMSQEDYGFKVEELTAKLNTQKATYQEQIERIRQLTEQYGENGLDVIENKARHEQLAIAIRATEREIASLTTSETTYSTATKKSWQQTMSQAEAFKLAKTQTADLLDFVSKLAVVSPFETETVEETTKYAIAAGMGLEATKEFVPAFLDLAASVGITSESLGFAADQLFQVKKIGKLTEVDLRQLRRIGIDLSKVIGVEMGMSVEEFNAQAEKSPEIFDELFAAVTRFSQNTFAGTSQEMATSVKGLKSTINDIFVIGSRTFMRPFVDAVTPAIAGIISKLSDFVLGGDLQEIGQQFAETFMGGFDAVSTVVNKIMRAFENFGIRGAAVSIVSQLGLDHATIMPAVDAVLKVIGKIQRAFNNFGIRGAAVSIMSLLGLEPAQIGTVFTTIDTIKQKVNELISSFTVGGILGEGGLLTALGLSPESIEFIGNAFDTISEILSNIGFEEVIGAITGVGLAIGGIVTGGIIASLVAGLAALLSPIALLIAGAALLGAAWAGNWFGIQEAVYGAWDTIKPVLTELYDWLSANIPAALKTVSDIWNNTLLPGFTKIADIVNAQLLPSLQSLFSSFEGGGGTQTFADIWNNVLLPALAAVGDFLVNTLFPAWVELEVWLIDKLSVAIQLLAAGWETILFPAISAVSDFIIDTVIPGVSELSTWLGDKIGVATQTMSDIWTNTLLPGLKVVGDYITENILPLLESIGKVTNSVINKALEASAGLWQNVLYPALVKVGDILKDTLFPFLQDVGKTVSDDVSPVLSELGEDILPPLAKGLDVITEAIKTATGYFNSLAEAVASFKVPAILDPHSPPPLAYALWDVASGATDAGAALKGMMLAAGTASGMAAQKDSLFAQVLGMGDIGHMMGRGLSRTKSEEIKAGYKTALATLWDEIVAGTKGAFDLEALTKQGSGNWAQFVKDADINFGKVVETIRAGGAEIAEELRKQMTDRMMGMAQGFASFGDALVQKLEGMNAATEAAKKSLESLNKTLGDQQSKLAGLKIDLAESIEKYGKGSEEVKKKQEAIAALTAEIKKNERATADQNKVLKQEARTSRSATIELLQQFMAGDEQLFKYTLKSDLTNTNQEMMDRNRAQEKLNQLLEEERKEQEKIAALEKARADLAFLQQQMSIIQLIKDSGLNVGDILGGITLGLGASIPDLLAVTSNLVAAMVGQINDDLQIASPSKLLFNTFKTNVGGAIAGGLMAAKGMVQGAVTPLVEPLLSIPDRANQSMRQTVNNFNMNVNTRADQSSVIGDFRVMQMMIGD